MIVLILCRNDYSVFFAFDNIVTFCPCVHVFGAVVLQKARTKSSFVPTLWWSHDNESGSISTNLFIASVMLQTKSVMY